ncbi:MAG: hypothetical protein WD557_14215 [Dehalococcoidia bacterium]
MISTVVLVPTYDNRGEPFGPDVFRDFEARLLSRFGGYTRATDLVGEWVDSGVTYRDHSRQYRVALGSWRALPAFLDLVDWARLTFEQEAMYIEVAGIPEILAPLS